MEMFGMESGDVRNRVGSRSKMVLDSFAVRFRVLLQQCVMNDRMCRIMLSEDDTSSIPFQNRSQRTL